ncbi:PHD and RING finger domain-containing protein 1 [Xylographa opegraphella]|nr:PHD and RING finger domain-containing protein 1 [Xylographa opegraphella]
MAETCIVCLGDLGESSDDFLLPLTSAIEAGPIDSPGSGAVLPHSNIISTNSFTTEPADLIAHLLPCGHNLHDECLKPWVERANSCPICRQNFNQVDLITRLGGPVISSYVVNDRVQVADVDPSILIEEFDDIDSPPCPKCGNDNTDDVLLLCDGCDLGYHLYCVDLDTVPEGEWFCDDCTLNRVIESSLDHTGPRNHQIPNNHARAQQRRSRYRAQTESSNWARVWQSVWDHLNVDLDFPYHDTASTAQLRRSQRREANQRRDIREWERRFEVAERQGGSNRFRAAASALLLEPQTISRPRPEQPEPESVEEILAWNALEKARDIESDPTPKSRKRKSTTNSPSDTDSIRKRQKRSSASQSPAESIPALQPERPLKRPQTRRIHNVVETLSDPLTEPANSRNNVTQSPRIVQQSEIATTGNGPSFLQSLLKEVELSEAPEEGKGQTRPLFILAKAAASGYSSPSYTSPGASPTASNHATPRALSITPPPSIFVRPGSPIPLSSMVEPIYPLPGFSHEPDSSLPVRQNSVSSYPHDAQRSRSVLQQIHYSSPPRSEEGSPSRINMPLSTKSEIQKLVKDALRLPYKNNELTKDQYTDINRHVSRMLYDKVGERSHLDGEAAETLRSLASDEVTKAIRSLRSMEGR